MSQSTALQTALKGCLILPLRLYGADNSDNSNDNNINDAVRHMYYRQHCKQSSDDELPVDCTLYVINVPSLFTSNDLSSVFSCFGSVKDAILLQQELSSSSTRTARIIYNEPDSVKRALSVPLVAPIQPFIPPSTPLGLERWLNDYDSVRCSNVDSLREQVNRFMQAFDRRTAAERRAMQQAAKSKIDEDGFIKVTYKRKLDQLTVDLEKDLLLQREAKKQRKRQQIIFYQNHHAEQKRRKIQALKQQQKQNNNKNKKARN